MQPEDADQDEQDQPLPNGAHGAPAGLQGFMPHPPKNSVITHSSQNQIPALMCQSSGLSTACGIGWSAACGLSATPS